MHFELNCVYRPRISYKKIPNSWYFLYVIAGAASTRKKRVYKNAMQILQDLAFSASYY